MAASGLAQLGGGDDMPLMQASHYMSTSYGGEGNAASFSEMAAAERTMANAKAIFMSGDHSGTVTIGGAIGDQFDANNLVTQSQQLQQQDMSMKKRFVRVLLVDPNDNIPLEKQVLFKGDEVYTDQTDEELRYELGLKEILATHNTYRVTVVDKGVKERTQHLEPARLRDLIFNVVTVAAF